MVDGQEATSEKRDVPVWERAFLSALALRANVSAACRDAGVNRQYAYRHRDAAPEFARLWKEALEEAADSLEHEAVRRARDGVTRPVLYQGQPCGYWQKDGVPCGKRTKGAAFVPLIETEYSDTLLIFLLKAHRPERFRDRLQLTGAGKDGEVVVKVLGAGASMGDL